MTDTKQKLKDKLAAKQKAKQPASKKQPAKKRVAEKGAKFGTREEWLNAAVIALRPLFDEIGAADYPKLRVSCGFPKGGRGKTIGQAWSSTCSGDDTAEVFISPELEELVGYGVVDTLLHELIHVIDRNENGHKGPFRKMAKELGLSGKMTATYAEGDLADKLLHAVAHLGPYPHAKLTKMTTTKQTTRMLKLTCSGCGFIARTTQKWLDEIGAPNCGCGAGQMEGPEE